MTVVPLSFPGDRGPDYRTLAEGIAGGKVRVTEVSKGGSVPNLMVVNSGSLADADPGRRGAGRGQAEPGAQHDDPGRGPLGAGRAGGAAPSTGGGTT